MSRVNVFMLKTEMILAAPGKGLHMLLRKLRKHSDIGRALFLLCTLALVGLGLWLMRKNTMLLLLGGAALAVVAFLLYKPVMKGLATFFMFLEAFTYLFAKSYDECRHGIKRYEREKRQREMTEEEKEAGRKAGEEAEKKAEEARAAAAREKEQREKEEWSKAKQRARQEQRREHTERKRRRMEEEAERERERRGGPHVKTDKEPHVSNAALDEAKSIFNVELPFTEEEIKEKRNMLIKKYHPDNPGGSEEMCKKINECYAILYKYAT